jgi:transcriptional regulator with XRE-family HTH domain
MTKEQLVQEQRTFGLIVQKLRAKQGIPAEVLACRCDMSFARLRRIERGLVKLNLLLVIEFTDVFKVPIRDLLPYAPVLAVELLEQVRAEASKAAEVTVQ